MKLRNLMLKHGLALESTESKEVEIEDKVGEEEIKSEEAESAQTDEPIEKSPEEVATSPDTVEEQVSEEVNPEVIEEDVSFEDDDGDRLVQKEAEEAEFLVDDITESSEALESVYITLESSLSNGGISPQAASFMQLHVSNLTGRFGIQCSQLATESFGLDSERELATRLSMEGIKDTLTKFWEMIKRAFKMAVEKGKELFKRFGDKTAILRAKLKGKLNKLKEMDDDTMVTIALDPIEVAALDDIKSISLEAAEPASYFKTIVANSESFLTEFNKVIASVYSEAVAELHTINGSNFSNLDKLDEKLRKLAVQFSKDGIAKAFPNQITDSDTKSTRSSAAILSGSAIYNADMENGYIKKIIIRRATPDDFKGKDIDNAPIEYQVRYGEIKSDYSKCLELIDLSELVLKSANHGVSNVMKEIDRITNDISSNSGESDIVKIVKGLRQIVDGFNSQTVVELNKGILRSVVRLFNLINDGKKVKESESSSKEEKTSKSTTAALPSPSNA